MDNFKNFLRNTIGVPAKDIEYWTALCSVHKIKKNDYILKTGKIGNYAYFSENGILRMYSINSKGKECIIQFGFEILFVFDHENFLNKPSKYYVQAIEDAEVVYIEKDIINGIIKSYPQSAERYAFLLNKEIARMQERINFFISATAEERYRNFLETCSDYIQRIPLYMVASYLGITPECLSRLRGELARG